MQRKVEGYMRESWWCKETFQVFSSPFPYACETMYIFYYFSMSMQISHCVVVVVVCQTNIQSAKPAGFIRYSHTRTFFNRLFHTMLTSSKRTTMPFIPCRFHKFHLSTKSQPTNLKYLLQQQYIACSQGGKWEEITKPSEGIVFILFSYQQHQCTLYYHFRTEGRVGDFF